MQKLLQEKLGREIQYVHCMNDQLHLVVVNTLTAEKTITDKWTGHLSTVTAIIKSYKEIICLLSEIDAEWTYGAEVRMEAIGIWREISQPVIMFITHFVKKVLILLDGPNKLLQSEDMDLLTEMELVVSATKCMSSQSYWILSSIWMLLLPLQNYSTY